MLLLALLAHAHARCAVERTPTPDGARIVVAAQAEPLSCRTVTLLSDAPITLDARLRGPDGRTRRLRGDHLRALPGGGWEIGAPELVVGGQIELEAGIAGSELTISLAPAEGGAVAAVETHTTRDLLLDARHPDWGFADAALARTKHEATYRFAPDGAAQVIPVPGGARFSDTPEARAAAGLEDVPGGLRVAAGTAEARVRYELRGAAPQGVERIPAGSLTLASPGVEWVVRGSDGVEVKPVPGGVRAEAPAGGVVRWRVASVGGRPVIPDLSTFIAGLEWRFARVSLPEPAVPMGLRGERDRAALLDSLYEQVRAMPTGRLPGGAALSPRHLNRAWRSGWGTDVEKGLILHRFLGQEKFPARWALTGSDPDPDTYTGYDTLLVLTELEGVPVWLDPGCHTCAPGEIRPRWMGRPAIGAVAALPRAEGALSRRLSLRNEIFEARFSLTGAAALWAREALAEIEPDRRLARLAELLGMPGAEVQSVEGLDAPGEPVVARLAGAAPPRAPFPADETPWVGGWEDILGGE